MAEEDLLTSRGPGTLSFIASCPQVTQVNFKELPVYSWESPTMTPIIPW